jgi:hypothetical protein
MARCSVAPILAGTAWRWGSEMRALVIAALMVLAACPPSAAAEWGTIVPAVSTMDSVRAQYGGPTRTETQKIEGYETTSWVYEGAQAPTGMHRMVVDFGLLQAGGFQRGLVRAFRLEPHAGVFTRETILAGWGRPSGFGKEGDNQSFFYADGLLVIFDKEAWSAITMVFTPPQPTDPARAPR